MKNEKFGSIMQNGKMIDLDRASLEDLEKVAENLKIKEVELKQKAVTVFKQ